jgi:hypothetical protein
LTVQRKVGKGSLREPERRKGLMTQIGKGGRNTRGEKERMDDPKWERRKECNGRKDKGG